jgi:hypothetical protein
MLPTKWRLPVVRDLCEPPSCLIIYARGSLTGVQNTILNIIHQIQDLESTAKFYSDKIPGWHAVILKCFFKVRNDM